MKSGRAVSPASYENGVLTVRFPERAERRNVRQIPVSSSSREQPPREVQAAKEKVA